MAHDLLRLMRPFATAIYAKAKALNDTDLADVHRRRLLESISDDIKKASNFHPHLMSKAARAQALAKDKGLDLSQKTWHEQHSFDPGRRLFLVEHMVPVSKVREMCCSARNEEGVLAILVDDIRVVWILRTEDEKLTELKYRSRRSSPAKAYEDARIEIWDAD
jgi:hypothetical protein